MDELEALQLDVISDNQTDQQIGLGSNLSKIGVALTGGGIRIASFACGALIWLVDNGIPFEHLSSASGGGYLASSFMLHLLEEVKQAKLDQSDQLTDADVFQLRKKAIETMRDKFKTPGYIIDSSNWKRTISSIIWFLLLIPGLLIFGFVTIVPWIWILSVPLTVLLRPILAKNQKCGDEFNAHPYANWLYIAPFLLGIISGLILLCCCCAQAVTKKMKRKNVAKEEQQLITDKGSKTKRTASQARSLFVIRRFLKMLIKLCALFIVIVSATWVGNGLDEILGPRLEEISTVSTISVLWVFHKIKALVTRPIFKKIGADTYEAVLIAIGLSKLLEWKVYQCSMFTIKYTAERDDLLFFIMAWIFFCYPIIYNFFPPILHAWYSWRLRNSFYPDGYGYFPSTSSVPMRSLANIKPEYHIAATVTEWARDGDGDSENYDLWTITPRSMGVLLQYDDDEPQERRPGRQPTPDHLTVSKAMALSAAAVANDMGRKSSSTFRKVAGLINMTDFGLGAWIDTKNTKDISKKQTYIQVACQFLVFSGAPIIASLNYFNYLKIDDHPWLGWLVILSPGGFVIALLVFIFWWNNPTLSVRRFRQFLGIPLYDEVPETVYLSDGGHMENLALLPLLAEKCEKIYVFDCEESSDLSALEWAMTIARKRFDIKFLSTKNGEDLSKEMQEFLDDEDKLRLEIRIRYPNNNEGTLYYHKALPSKVGESSAHPPYGCCCTCTERCCCCMQCISPHPTHCTLNQCFTPNMFQHYEALGYRLASGGQDINNPNLKAVEIKSVPEGKEEQE